MMHELELRVVELERLMGNMIQYGTIDVLSGHRASVRAGDLVTDFLPWLTRRAGNDRDWWAPEPGEQVMLLCPCGDPALGLILPSVNRDAYPHPANTPTVHRTVYADSAVIEYDRDAHRLKAVIPGTIEATAKKVIVTADVEINGRLDVTKEITSAKSVSAPALSGSQSVAAPSIKSGGKEVTRHNHACPHGGRTSNL